MAENKPGTYGYNKEYAKKYMAKLSEIKVRMSPEEKEAIAAAAQRSGVSVNQYVISAVERRMNRTMERNEILGQLQGTPCISVAHSRKSDDEFEPCKGQGIPR